jgi:hypothetical protein
MSSDCPPLEILSAYLEHALTAEEQEAVEHHLVGCWKCREILKQSIIHDEPPDKESP